MREHPQNKGLLCDQTSTAGETFHHQRGISALHEPVIHPFPSPLQIYNETFFSNAFIIHLAFTIA